MKSEEYYRKTIKKNFSERLNELLYTSKFTAREFAERINVAHESVNRWLAGDRLPSLCNAKKIADFFYKDLDYFVD